MICHTNYPPPAVRASSPAVIAQLGVALILGQETARKVVVRMQHGAEDHNEGAEHERPDQVLSERTVHLRHELSEIVVVLQVVAQARQRAGSKATPDDKHRAARDGCPEGAKACGSTKEAHGDAKAPRMQETRNLSQGLLKQPKMA